MGSPRLYRLSIQRPAVDKARRVRLTIHHSLTGEGDVDLEVARGTPLLEIVAEFGAPVVSCVVWCGSERIQHVHEAGEWPLVAGAILSAHPRPPSASPGALHLVAIAGPDAGVIIPIDRATAIGSALPSAVVRDETIDARHATVSPTRNGALRVKDLGSVNGTGVWSARTGALSWRGRRLNATVRVGDVIGIGTTLLEVRRGFALGFAHGFAQGFARGFVHGFIQDLEQLPEQRPAMAATSEIKESAPPTRSNALRRGTLTAIVRATFEGSRFLDLAGRWRGHDPPHLSGLPDPTGADGWSGPVAIEGPHAIELTRAVILARGRRPPHPMPLHEKWLTWLPPALSSDGAIRIGAESTITGASGWTLLKAEDQGTTSRIGAATTTGPAVRVGADTADALARSRAGSVPDAGSRVIHWADAAALAARPSAGGSTLRIVAGVRFEDSSAPWTIPIGPGSRHTLVAGAPGSGKTTLLATIAGALAIEVRPQELALVVLCAGDPGALEAYMDLPHVVAAQSHVRPREALRIINSLDTHAAITVVIADDIDALGPDGRAVTARLEEIAARGGPRHVHVVMATRRPTAVFTPSLRAATGTAIALRSESAADSLEVTGIDAAAGLPIDGQGTAFVRSAGSVDRVQVALPYADRLPRVRRCGAPPHEATTLATAARATVSSTRRDRPGRVDRALPAS